MPSNVANTTKMRRMQELSVKYDRNMKMQSKYSQTCKFDYQNIVKMKSYFDFFYFGG